MQDFEFKETDVEGMQTLDVISQATRFNEWMYDTIKPYCHGSILEIGSGIGNISRYFIRDKSRITLSDIRDNYCQVLRERYASESSVEGVLKLDLVHPEFDTVHADLINRFDSVFALNVVEHIKNDHEAIANCYKVLKPGGSLVILVPAYQFLYNKFDQELEHYRRYTKSSLSKVISECGFEIRTKRYFNLSGIAGWFVSGKLQQNKTIPEGQMKLYNNLVPVFKMIDTVSCHLAGLSVIVVGSKS